MKKILLSLCLTASMGGCAVFTPFDGKFMCEKTDDYGRCIGVQDAYEEAVFGDPHTPPTHDTDPNAKVSFGAMLGDVRSRYKAAEYLQMTQLIEEPVTPIVKPPKVLRTLIVAYPGGNRTLFSSRYVWFIADESKFVLGDYLNEPSPHQAPMMTPFSGDQ